MSEYIDDDEAEFIANEVARIAALHKSAPEIIWLQVDPEAEQFDGGDAQTWCSDQINGTDLKYLKAISAESQIAELKQQRDAMQDWLAPQPAIPDGMVLVKKSELIEASNKMLISSCGVCRAVSYVLEAMLAAAPKPGERE